MTSETAVHAAVKQAALAFDRGLVTASQRVRARSQRHPTSLAPWALAAAALALVLMPKRMRKPVLSAGLPLALTWVRGLFH